MENASDAQRARLIALKKFRDDFYHKMYILQWEILGAYFIMFLLSLILLTYLRRNRQVALLGDADAARKVILPAYEPLLWIVLVVSSLFTAFFAIIVGFHVYDEGITQEHAEVFNVGRNFVATLVMIFMHQKSLTLPALRRASLISAVIAVYPVPIMTYMKNRNVSDDDTRTFTYVARGVMIAAYLYVIVRPPARASKWVLREYSIYSILYLCFLYGYSELFGAREIDMAMHVVLVTAMWVSFYPIFIYRVLKADTEHWRGLGQRACQLQMLLRQKRKMNERVSSEGLHVMIEMHRKYIIDFAYLELVKPIGHGATATVFMGTLHSKKQVAVKVYTPKEVTEDAVAEFSNEAALCGALQHPNIVSFYGMCVFPPNICLVSELCLGSLEEILTQTSTMALETPARRQLNINVGYMLDAARAVSYLHSFSPAFIHRDIKPANFLVDYSGNVKLTDFGESRSLPSMQGKNMQSPRDSHNVLVTIADDSQESQSEQSILDVKPIPNATCMTVRGTVDYMAPELINCRAGKATYGEGADVYSLAITMWEILHPGQDKYPSDGSHLKVYEWVLEGRRPPILATTHPRLKQLIENSWNADVAMRPSATDIVHILEEVQEETQATLAARLQKEMPLHNKKTWKGKTYTNVFTGEEAIAHMLACDYVDSTSEAIRIGNAMMDAGLIHHAKHQRGFEESNSMYYFEDQKILDCQPVPERDSYMSGTSSENYSIPSLHAKAARKRMSSDHSSISTSYSAASSTLFSTDGTPGHCICRKLAQGFDRPKHKQNPNRKIKSNKNSNILTTKLLNNQESSDASHEFEDF